jgi:hypothetical protein
MRTSKYVPSTMRGLRTTGRSMEEFASAPPSTYLEVHAWPLQGFSRVNGAGPISSIHTVKQ